MKVHAPWAVLTEVAEFLGMKKPIRVRENVFAAFVSQSRFADRLSCIYYLFLAVFTDVC